MLFHSCEQRPRIVQIGRIEPFGEPAVNGFEKFARLQILTMEDLFAGKKPAMPPEDPAAFKRAAREEDKTRQAKLL